MIRSELVQKIASENSDLRLEEIERIVDTFFDSIVDQLAAGGRVELRGFGAFSTRARESRTGRNPRHGAAVDVKAKRVRTDERRVGNMGVGTCRSRCAQSHKQKI